MMTLAQVVETSVTVTENSPFQDYPHPDDHTTQSTVTPGFKPFTVFSLFADPSIVHVVLWKIVVISMERDRAEKRLRMPRNSSEKLGDTMAFCYSFAIELLLCGQFLTSVQVWNGCVQNIFCTPVTVWSVAKVLSYVLIRAENLVAFQFFKNSAILL